MLQSLMQDVPLTLGLVRERVASLYREKTVTTRYSQTIEVASYLQVLERSAQLAGALQRLGVKPGDRVASLAWNSQRHLELYLAVPCMGAVLHTVNARLSGDAIASLFMHAGDRVAFVESSLLPALRGIKLPDALHHIVVLRTRHDGNPDIKVTDMPRGVTLVDYEELISTAGPEFDWPDLDERTPSGLCYTSGTTGAPKGILYSHRSATLHTLACLFADGIAMRERDVCMPVVPMYHANAWGFPYAALTAGAALALPCRQTDWESLVELIEKSGVTMATAVPTVWLDVLEALRSGRIAQDRIKSLQRIPMGGSAVSKALIDGFAEFGIEVTHCWGMTEISPLGLVNVPKSTLSDAEAASTRSAQGLPIPCCALKVVGVDGQEAPRDGSTPGELQIRSPWAADAYFAADKPGNRSDEAGMISAFATDARGRRWLRTGDVATIDRHGYVRIVDRTKDLIKSGGEWISSQGLEARLLEHPAVREAAVVAKADAKWQERPVAFITLLRQTAIGDNDKLIEELTRHLAKMFAKWQLPDEFIVLPDLPKNSTGKIDKIALRLRVETHSARHS